MTPNAVPRLLPILVMGDDAKLLALASTLFAEQKAYLPLLDGPRTQRDDADAEVIRRNNAAARVQPHTIILAGLPNTTCDLFSAHFPPSRTQRISTAAELRALPRNGYRVDLKPVVWGNRNIGLGVLRALRSRREIAFDDNAESPRDAIASDSGHLIVCEDDHDVAQVIAANYAYSLGAGLSLIPPLADEIAEALLEQFYTVYEDRARSPSARLLGLKHQLRTHIGNLHLPPHGSGCRFRLMQPCVSNQPGTSRSTRCHRDSEPP